MGRSPNVWPLWSSSHWTLWAAAIVFVVWPLFPANATGEVDNLFRSKVDKALTSLRQVLNETRHPKFPSDVPHAYEDKYLLAELATRAAAAAVFDSLELGMPGWSAQKERLVAHGTPAGKGAVWLRFQACELCEHTGSTVRELESPKKAVTRESSSENYSETTKMVTTIEEHAWQRQIEWRIVAITGPEDEVEIVKASGRAKMSTTTSPGATPEWPFPQKTCPITQVVDISWLLSTLKGQFIDFAIKRSAADCHTPRRNSNVENALTSFRDLRHWAHRVRRYFEDVVFAAQSNHGHDINSIWTQEVFAPVFGLFALDGASGDGPLVLSADFQKVLQEHRRSLGEKMQHLSAMFPTSESGGLVIDVAARLLAALFNIREIGEQHARSIDHIEAMLRNQLVAAVGKELHSDDFAKYMDFHQRSFFLEEYRPKVFSYSVRKPGRNPEGTLSIEEAAAKPISTLVLHKHRAHPMRFELNAGTEVTLFGDHSLHACVLHTFAGDKRNNLQLSATARQFSSFILLAGRLLAADVFEPKAALIVKDKDSVIIPLLLETLPTPAEFRDAIESLSEEQQRFAKAFRSMQLSSSVFCVAIVQIKPQMERLLNLPADSLTKEIQLTQDLMEMFIKYQVPPDLLSYSGEPDADAESKLRAVKNHVSALWSTIDAARKRELAEEEAKAQKRKLNSQAETEQCAKCGRDGSGSGEEIHFKHKPIQVRNFARMGAVQMMDFSAFGESVAARSMPEMAAAGATRSAASLAPSSAPSSASFSADQSAQATSERGRPKEPLLKQGSRKPTADEPADHSSTDQQSQDTPLDYTAIPAKLDSRFDAYDSDSVLRSTTISLGDVWEKVEQPGLLSPAVRSSLHEEEQKDSRQRTFDLLDALTRSGALPLEDASLHVVLAATHAFDDSLINTVVKNNLNPIEKVERSLLIVSSTIHGRSSEELLAAPHLDRVRETSPQLFA